MVELAGPWDPARVVGEYLEYRQDGLAAPSSEDLAALHHGCVLRFDLEHRSLGTVEAELHLDVLQATRVQVELGAMVWLRWWWRPLAWPFRPRLRRWINARVDEMLEELAQDGSVSDAQQPAQLPAGETASQPPGSSNVRWTLQILTPSGRSVYQRTEERS